MAKLSRCEMILMPLIFQASLAIGFMGAFN